MHDGIDLFSEAGCHRGVVAKAEIQKGEQLLLVPKKVALFVPKGISMPTFSFLIGKAVRRTEWWCLPLWTCSSCEGHCQV